MFILVLKTKSVFDFYEHYHRRIEHKICYNSKQISLQVSLKTVRNQP